MAEKPQPEALLSARLSVQYGGKTPVLRDLHLELSRGEVLGLIGQSGSGKSTLAMAILGLLDRSKARAQGSILFEGSDLLVLRESELRNLRGQKIALVLQSPLSSLNPALRIRTQLREAWRAHASGSSSDCDQAIRNALQSVSLPADDDFLRKYPAQMSVGQAQRVLIAMAIVHRPALLIADEATSALDVITQAEILKLFRELNQNSGMAILYISHDLASVAGICDRVAILHQGQIVESGVAQHVLTTPTHEYTQRLLASMPRMPKPIVAGKAAAR
ncbi:MAG TPA: ABC transporter ATP-binding protein [Candidatus Binatia bacterium]|nr:ABC transporter ATP-binding protein [Candidatus Binatia bacterium]